MNDSEALRILNAYARALDQSIILGTRDSRELPQPKRRIKEALLMALRGLDDNSGREGLRTMFVQLGKFQDLSAAQAKALQVRDWSVTRGAQALTIEEIKREALEIAEIGDVLTSLDDACLAEMEQLSAELKALRL